MKSDSKQSPKSQMQPKKILHQIGLVSTGLLIFSALIAGAAEYTVSNKTALNTAIAAAKPGDTIIMADGTWTNTTINLTTSGTSTSLITLRAKTPGKVVLNGTSTLTFSKPYWVVSGLNFNQGAIPSGQIIAFNSTRCRLTNSAIINYNPTLSTTAYYWIFFSGSYNRVDHCYFEGKNHQQPVVGNNFDNSRYNAFDNNYVYDIPYIAGVNGREIFRIWGYGRNEETGTDGAFFTIENNLLEKADGEGSEIISLKSSRNIVRNNTILGTRGGIVIRGGRYNTIQGNFILGKNVVGAYGIRMAGPYHTVTNNHISDCDSGITMHVGEYIDTYLTPDYMPVLREGTPLGRVPAYSHVKDCTIAFNTVVNANGLDLNVGSSYKGYWPTQQRVLIPQNNKIANNLFVKLNGKTSVSSPAVDTEPPLDIFTFLPNIYEGNLAYGGAIALHPMPSSGFSTQDPLVTKDADGIYRIASNSPAIDAAEGIYSDVTDDMDGQPRSGPKDIGADEYSNSPALRKPLTSDDVGPEWLKIEPPSDFSATIKSSSQINLSWNDFSFSEDGFSIERSLDGSTWTVLTLTGPNVTTYSDTGLNALTTYYYRAKAVKSNESTEYSNTATATTPYKFYNIALNKPATASSTWSVNYEASKSVDDNYSTRWAAASGISAVTLEVDLENSHGFGQVVLREYAPRVSSFKIQYWNGTAWLDAFTGTTIGTTDRIFSFPEVAGTKVRLNILACSTAAPSIWEFVVNGYESIVPGSFTAWQVVNFDAAQRNNAAISGPTASALGDGYANLLKYHLGVSAWDHLPPGTMASEFSEGQLSLTYRRSRDAPGAVGAVEWSATLAPDSWSTEGVATEVIEQDSTHERVRASIPAADAERLFFRLRVTAP